MTKLLEGRVGIVSGIGPGLGRRIALAFAGHGADVVLGARTESYLKEVAEEVSDLGVRALAVPTDVTDREQCVRLVRSAHEEFGRVDVLVNNAFRYDDPCLFVDADLDHWREIFDVNVFGPLTLTQEAARYMKEAGGGSIVFVGTMATHKPTPYQGGYSTSKGAVAQAVRVLAGELGAHKIRVNSVVPGWMDGPPVRNYFTRTQERTGRSVQEQHDEVAARIPLGVIPTDEQCARVVVFLASDLSAAVTGHALDSNGGEVLH